MNFFTENKRAAVIALIVAVIFSVTAGAVRGISGLSDSLTEAYKNSGAAEDMAILLNSADQVIAVYKAVIGDGKESEAEASLAELSDKAEPTVIDGTDANALRQNTAVLYNALLASGKMTDAQEFTAMKYYYDMLNAWTMLCENSEYFDEAERYNDAVSSVPLVFFKTDKAAVFGWSS